MLPFCKWPGGKRSLVPELVKEMPSKFGCYYEPFCGGGALFFDQANIGWVSLHKPCLNDANPHLMAAYMALRDEPERLIRNLKGYAALHKSGGEKFYYQARAEQIDPVKQSVRAAGRFLFLNRTCFNGLWRVNKKGEFNVPYGKWKTSPNICPEELLREASKALQGVKLTCLDFEKSVNSAERGDFVYFDPPYVPASASSNFTAYCKESFGPVEQERLRDCALELRSRGVHVLLSNSDTPIVRKLYMDFDSRRIEARRSINSKPTSRGPVGERIIW